MLLAAASLALAATTALTGCVGAAPRASSSPSTGPTPDVTKTVPAPSGGTVDDVVPSVTAPPDVDAALGKPAAVDAGVTVTITSAAATKVTAHTPGEVDGAAVRVGVTVHNGGTATASVDSAVVALVAADGTLGIGTTAGKPEPFGGTVAPGGSATASYVFMLADPRGRKVTITVSHAAGAPVARFEGSVS